MMSWAYLRMKLSSLKMKSERVLDWLMPGRCSRVVRRAAPPSESDLPPAARPPPPPRSPTSSPPSSLSADNCAVILHRHTDTRTQARIKHLVGPTHERIVLTG